GPLADIAEALPGDLGRAIAAGARPGEIFASLHAEMSRPRPIALVIEDAHWADTATIDLLRFVMRRVGSTRAVVIVPHRADEVGPKHPLRQAIGDLSTSGAPRRLDLPPPSEARGGPLP